MISVHRDLPQSGGPIYLNDSGLETTLVFHEGVDLPAFAAYPLVATDDGAAWLEAYFGKHLALAEQHGTGYVLDTPTWRANSDWGATLGHSPEDLDRYNRQAVRLCTKIRESWIGRVNPIVIAGILGPRGDGYKAGTATVGEAESYHRPQIATLSDAGVDLIAAYTLSTVEEAIGIVRAASDVGVPVAISFTVETDGRLASGMELGTAIERVDHATNGAAAYFMVNCAHPTHFAHLLESRPSWAGRIAGIKANASTMSHAELDVMTEIDDGDPEDLGRRYLALSEHMPSLAVLGGCCGTDHRHVEAIAGSCCAHVRLARRDA